MSHQHELKARRQQLEQLLQGSPYLSYLYSYPHKTAHRPLDPPRPLGALWREERRHALFLYLHVPFCAMHCGYCNLLSNKSRPRPEQIAGFLGALERQAAAVQQALGSVTFARLAIGGGTPTVLTEAELSRLLQVAESMVGGELDSLPSAVEVSPETASEAKLCLLRERGISRLSIGIQSFIQDELRALGRAQTVRRAHESLQRIFELEFPTVNIDLIYGIEGQTEASLGDSLGQALRYQPTEIFLYPLYVRPLTPLGQADRATASALPPRSRLFAPIGLSAALHADVPAGRWRRSTRGTQLSLPGGWHGGTRLRCSLLYRVPALLFALCGKPSGSR
jgi:oxygen-independent coproporphyrinogen-3 oxidase